jgi:hypothetical protein
VRPHVCSHPHSAHVAPPPVPAHSQRPVTLPFPCKQPRLPKPSATLPRKRRAHRQRKSVAPGNTVRRGACMETQRPASHEPSSCPIPRPPFMLTPGAPQYFHLCPMPMSTIARINALLAPLSSPPPQSASVCAPPSSSNPLQQRPKFCTRMCATTRAVFLLAHSTKLQDV